MKNIILPLLFLFLACKAPVIYIGMPIQEFTKKNNGITLVETSLERTVYKKVNHPFGQPPRVRFFYFVDNKLIKMDEGVLRPDILIQQNIR